ncbi:MAG: hypothetical protein MAGBODY4_00421 [Candidatus Marinimicrobia bacterium]|nr:hypothetical protein [Candidatus Neomarinimicrobiota bacterium]
MTVLIGAVVSVVIALQMRDASVTWALIVAPVITALNAIIGVYFLRKGINASQTTFMKIVFGGMGIRLLVLGAIIALIYVRTPLHFLTFLMGTMAYYIVFMVLEILYVHFHLRKEQ